jgi:hypothetical protein
MDEIKRAAEGLLSLFEKEEIPLHAVVKRANAALENSPEDPAIKAFTSAIRKRLHKDAFATITREEVSSMYNDVSGMDSGGKLQNFLGDMLPELRSPVKKAYEVRYDKPIELDSHVEFDGLDDVFEKHQALTPVEKIVVASKKLVPELVKYDDGVAKIGKDIVEISFKAAGFDSEAAPIMGDDNNIIYCVAVDSPYKKHMLFVPTAVKDGTVDWPTHFIYGDGVRQISRDEIQNYISGEVNKAPDYNKLFDKSSSIDDSVKLPNELKTLVANLEEDLVESGTSVGRAAAGLGKEAVKLELESLGCRVDSVKVASEHNDGIIYSAHVISSDGKLSVEVPVEFNDDKPILPTSFAYKDDFRALNAENLRSVIQKNASSPNSDFGVDVANLTFHELKEKMLYSVASKDYDKAEEILNFIGKKFGGDTFKQAFSDYTSAMIAITKMASLDKCRGCPFLERAGKYHACDYCTKFAMDASKIVKTASGCMRYERATGKTPYTNQGMSIKLGDE